MRFTTILAAVLLVGTASAANAGAVVAGFDANTQTKCDDCATASGAFGSTLNFFGQNYASGFVSSNGYITFGAAQTSFTPEGLGAGYTGLPIIAAYYADVETTPAAGGTVTFGNGSFAGRSTFGATWNAVGRFNDHTDLKNTFQILLVDRADVASGDFDIYLNYDQVQWDASDSAGAPSVGYANGTGAAGSYYQLPGSLSFGNFRDGDAMSLVAGSNVGVAGRYMFNVRSGTVTPPPGVPEPATWAMMIGGFGLTGAALRRRANVSAAIA